MLTVMIKGKVRELPLSEIYENEFNKYVQGGYIDLDKLDENTRYKIIDELFGFVSRSIVVVLGELQEECPDYEYAEEIYNVRSKIAPVDSIQRFLYKSGDTLKSIDVIEKFMEEMLNLWDKVYDPAKKNKMNGIKGR